MPKTRRLSSSAAAPRPKTGGAAPSSLIRDVIERLGKATRPAIVAGIGAWWTRAGEPLQAFIEQTHIPLFTVELARGLVSDDHPLCLGAGYPSMNPLASKLREA